MISIRPASYSKLPYDQRMQYMAHRAKVYLSKPDYWLKTLQVL